ncbi:MAG: radical SAM protein [Anaerolineae bacterium]|nr:radical SAM protein [Anaerolineae bacterium]
MMPRLREGVHFVQGAKNAALYDIENREIYALNESARKILVGEGIAGDEKLLRQLIDLGLAYLSEEQPHQDDTHLSDLSNRDTSETERKLKFIWFEILTQHCNLGCIHCYASCIAPNKKYENEIPNRNDRIMKFAEWQNTIRQSYSLGCRDAQFIGGEPFLYKGENRETVLDLMEYAIDVGFESVEVFTNGTLLRHSHAERLREMGAKVAISIYSSDPNIHDKITKVPGSHKRAMNAVNFLKELDIPIRLETVVMRVNQDTISETVNYISDLGVQGGFPHLIYPTGRASNTDIYPDQEKTIQNSYRLFPDFELDANIYQRSINGNNCLSGKIAISADGDVLPCIFARDTVLGNILDTHSLADIISKNNVQLIWQLSKDYVLVCQDCEYRYACLDCRPLAYAMNANTNFMAAPSPRCTYNPYTGNWGNGIWHLDEQGLPYYCMDDAEEINQARTLRLFQSQNNNIR